MFNNLEKHSKISLIYLCWVILGIITILFIRYFTDLFAILAIAISLTYILLWPVKAIEKFLPGIDATNNRIVSALLVYVLSFIVITIIGVLMIEPVTQQLVELSQTLPRDIIKIERSTVRELNKFSAKYGLTTEELPSQQPDQMIDQLSPEPETKQPGEETAGQFSVNIFKQFENIAKQGAQALPVLVGATFRNVIYAILITMLSFYFILSEHQIREFLRKPFIGTSLEKISDIETTIHRALIGYIRGQAIIGFVTGLFMGIVYYAFDLRYGLALAIIIGVGQFVPFIGQALGIIAALIVALVQDPFAALIILIIFTIFQIFSNNVMVPILLGDMTGMSPVIVIISLIIGERIAGILGVFLAVPVASIIMILLRNFWPPLIDQPAPQETTLNTENLS
jgi:predicted PurR-regulated permease PerM